MRGIIDRFEGEYAVVEVDGRRMENIPRTFLPPESKEGDVVEYQNGVYLINQQETQKRKDEIGQFSKELWED